MSTSPVKELQDTIVLILGVVLLIVGLQTFLNGDERQKPAAVTRALSLMIFGLFILALWYSVMRVPSTGSGGGYKVNNMYRSNYRLPGYI